MGTKNKPKTKKPTGLSISRDGFTFKFEWKIGTVDYGAGQELQWRRRKGNGDWSDWNTKTVTNTQTSAQVTFTRDNYTPYTKVFIKAVEFRVRGCRNAYQKDGKTITPTMSSWSYKTIDIINPNKPVLSASLTESNVTTFTWAIETSASDAKMYSRYNYESIRVAESNETDGSKLSWDSSSTGYRSGTGTAVSGSLAITEDTTAISSGSHTRWFRIRARGVNGDSDWVYAKHVYAMPKRASIKEKTKATRKSYGYLVEVVWKVARSNAYPIDVTSVQYAKAVPIEDMKPPENISWTEASTSADTRGTDTSVFTINGALADDECLFVQVKTTHDSNNNYSAPYMVHAGNLARPSTPTVTVSGSTATVTVTNNSSAGIYTGNLDYSKLFLHIMYKGAVYNTKGIDVGIIPYGEDSITFDIPNFADETAYSFGAKAIVGKYSGVSITQMDMESSRLWTAGNVPKSPTGISAEFTSQGDVIVSWSFGWDDADSTEVSWAYTKDAWDSTDEPESHLVEDRGRSLRISNVEVGKTLYIKARHKMEETFSPYSDSISVDLTLPPRKPILSLSDATVTQKGKFTVSWNFESGDGSDQSYAELRTISGSTIGSPIATVTNAKYITLYPKDLGWTSGNHSMVLRVKSESGSYSEYSEAVTVKIKDAVVASISSHNLTANTGTPPWSLTSMPLTVSVSGASNGETVQLAIERTESYMLDRPDENTSNGYKGETVYYKSITGNGTFTIDKTDLIGQLDDGAKYTIVATVSDALGQVSNATLEFQVAWSHQAIMPMGNVIYSGGRAVITPIAPTGALDTDYCDIYRLSADKPQLIVPNASFGIQYVDPYPTIGEFGGYRIVFLTANGDYITTDNTFAWLDIEGGIDYDRTIITFGTDSIELYYNVDANHTWEKDFIEVKYLGGSVQGYWNPAVSRSGSVSAVTLNPLEQETIQGLRRLAVYTGICNIRTLDGSNYSANIDVSENNSHDRYGLVSEFTLNITRVDPETYDGLPLSMEG